MPKTALASHGSPDGPLRFARRSTGSTAIVELLNERLALAAEIGKLKRSSGGQIYVPEREDAVLRKVSARSTGADQATRR
jgi:chorismate mutase